MAKQADAKDLGSFGATRTGSIPAIRTTVSSTLIVIENGKVGLFSRLIKVGSVNLRNFVFRYKFKEETEFVGKVAPFEIAYFL